MSNVEKLNKLLESLGFSKDDYWVEWQPGFQVMSTGEVYRGYLLHERPEERESHPGRHDWAEYVNGRNIGDNFASARAEILELANRREIEMLIEGHVSNEELRIGLVLTAMIAKLRGANITTLTRNGIPMYAPELKAEMTPELILDQIARFKWHIDSAIYHREHTAYFKKLWAEFEAEGGDHDDDSAWNTWFDREKVTRMDPFLPPYPVHPDNSLNQRLGDTK